jgi:hypothetical protein
VNFTGSSWMPPGHTFYAGYNYDAFIDDAGVEIFLHATNSESVLTKPVTCTIIFTE